MFLHRNTCQLEIITFVLTVLKDLIFCDCSNIRDSSDCTLYAHVALLYT